MLFSLIKYFRGYVYVCLSGYAPERFLNLCSNHDILIWNLKPNEDGYCFCISVQGFKQLKPILRKTRTHVKIIRKVGAPFGVYHYRKRKVFCLGIFLFAMLLYGLSGYVWNIEVNGNSYLSTEVVLDFLAEEEASFGTKIKDIDCTKLEEALRSQYREVIWTSIKIYGTKMTVDIQENLLPEETYTESDETIYDIVAAKDGIITQMVTRNGTPCTAVGAEVKKGDLLVSGCIEIQNDDGEIAQYLYHSSDADILAKVTYVYEDVIPAVYIDKVSKDEPVINYQLTVFGKTLKNPLFRLKDAPYEIMTDTTQLHVTDNFYLPVYLMKQVCQEYENVEKTHTESEVKKIASVNLKNYLEDLEEKGIQIIEKNVIIEKRNQKYVVKGTIDAYESIVSYQPTEHTDITSEERQLTDESD